MSVASGRNSLRNCRQAPQGVVPERFDAETATAAISR
jgi:hypothetical protein